MKIALLLIFLIYFKSVQGIDGEDDDDTCTLSFSLCSKLDKNLKDLGVEAARGHQEILAKLDGVQLHDNQPSNVQCDSAAIKSEISRFLQSSFERFERNVLSELRREVEEAAASQVQSVSRRLADLERTVREIKSNKPVQIAKEPAVDEYCVKAGKIGLLNVNGKKTYISQNPETWQDAKTKCESSGMTLAVTTTLAQMEALWKAFQASSKPEGFGIWVAASNLGKTDQNAYYWPDGRSVGANLWGSGQPNNGLNACGNLYGPRLYDLPCNSKVYYACHLLKDCN
ncbi:C-type lectin domain family 4 member M-like [Cloeon dipterum]|uniref:C-type lectin domain family 4 member M-like n=1 Tax=Cloeon dipterum TaxID=197152 RepID=UPI0032208C93